MLSDKLKSWEYYKNKLPLYIQNSYGIDEHFKIILSTLLQLDIVEDDVIKAFNIFDDNYLSYINSLDLSTTKDHSDILDKIGELYGVTRNFDVTYTESGTEKTGSLHLTNSEFLKLIKARLIQNSYSGTYEDSRKFYEMIDLPIYLFQSQNPAEVYVYLDESAQLTDNEKKMFLSNLFTITSMGITYITNISNIVRLFVWDSTIDNRFWDKGRWGV